MVSFDSTCDGTLIINDNREEDMVFVPVADYVTVAAFLLNKIREQGLYKPN